MLSILVRLTLWDSPVAGDVAHDPNAATTGLDAAPERDLRAHGLMALLPESARELVETFRRRFKLGRVGTLNV